MINTLTPCPFQSPAGAHQDYGKTLQRTWTRLQLAGLEVLLLATKSASYETRELPELDTRTGVLVVDANAREYGGGLSQLTMGLGLHMTRNFAPGGSAFTPSPFDWWRIFASEWAADYLWELERELRDQRERERALNPNGCMAVKRDGTPCQASRMLYSDYCRSHRGWYPEPTRGGRAKRW